MQIHDKSALTHWTIIGSAFLEMTHGKKVLGIYNMKTRFSFFNFSLFGFLTVNLLSFCLSWTRLTFGLKRQKLGYLDTP